MAADNNKNLNLEKSDSFSDEEITSYQVPHSISKVKNILNTPGSPPICFLPSSLQSSMRRNSIRRSASLTKCSLKPKSSIKQCSAPTVVQSNVFQSLGMNDKDISWVSSMESLVADGSPRLEFNTIERATFLPNSDKVNHTQIQRRALFPSKSDDSLGFQPLDSSPTSDDGKSYTRETRLSDVCDILKTLGVMNTASNEIVDRHCYEFEVTSTMPCSPSLFSPGIKSDIFFSRDEVEKQSSPMIRLSKENPGNSTSNSPVGSSSTPQVKSKLISSPCIFSPKCIPSPIQPGPSKLLPIEEVSSMEGSVLEIPLEETPNFKSQVKCEKKIIDKNIDTRSSVAKCLTFKNEIDEKQLHEDVSNTALVVKNINERARMNKCRTGQSKKLFGTSNNVTPFEASDIEDILKALEENENASSQFFNCIVKDKKVLPKSDDIMSFSDFIQTQKLPSGECSLKRRAELELPTCAKKTRGNDKIKEFLVPDQLEKSKNPNHVKLEKSAWNSKNKHLIDSQVDVSDTQIFQICEEVELEISRNTEAELKCLIPRKKGLGSRSNKKMFLKDKAENNLPKIGCVIKGKENNSIKTTYEVSEFQNVENNDLKSNDVGLFIGFHTGNSKIIKPSITAVDKVRNVFKDMDDKGPSDLIENVNLELKYDNKFNPYSGNNPNIPSSLHQTDINTSKMSTKPDILFQTRNKETIQLSNTSKNIFNDIEECKNSSLLSKIKPTGIEIISERVFCDDISAVPIFTGFRTGNNSIVKPSKSSMNKVKNIFDELDLKDELPGDNILEVILDNPLEKKSVCDKLTETKFNGFRTGNNSIVKPSKSSMNKVRNIFDDIDSNEKLPGDKFTEVLDDKFEMPSACDVHNSDTIVKPTKSSTNKVCDTFHDFDFRDNLSNNRNPFTASTDKSDVGENYQMIKPRDFSQGSGATSNLYVPLINDSSKPFLGFQTGNNKFVKPSTASLAKVKNIFENIDDKTEDVRNDMEKVVGFKTGSNKFIKPSSAALAKAKNIFDNVDCNNIEGQITGNQSDDFEQISKTQKSNEIEKPILGFKTGNNQFVKPSSSALEKVRNIFDNIDCDIDGQTVQNKRKDLLQLPNRKENLNEIEKPILGFKTGNNKFVKPSSSALAKIKNIFDSIDCDTDGQIDEIKDKQISKNENLNEIEKPILGFQTGNNKFVKPSSAALAKIKNIFDSIDCDNDGQIDEIKDKQISKNENLNEIEKPILGFQTGNNKFVKPSSAASAKVKNIFDNIDCDTDTQIVENKGEDLKQLPNNNEQFDEIEKPILGFKTGNNQFVKPSSTALAKVKKIFENVEDDVKSKIVRETIPSFNGFHTGNNNLIKPSKAALAKVKNIFENIDDLDKDVTIGSKNEDISNVFTTEEPQRTTEFSGFSTGNKSVIRPSEEALAKVRKMFEDDCQSNSSNVQNAANCKKLVVSETNCKYSVENIHKNNSNFNVNKENDEITKLDESYTTLLENTDWDDNIIPDWLHHSPNINQSGNNFIHPASKRNASSDISLPCKRRKSDINEILNLRKDARVEQLRLGGKLKEKVKPQSGSYILRKNLVPWQDVLRKGPEKVQYGELMALKFEQDVLDITADNSVHYRFKAERYFCEYEGNINGFELEDGFNLIFDDAYSAGVDEFESSFLAGPGVEPGLVPAGWVAHHFGLIVWKLACYQRTCFKHLCKLPLTPNNVMLQLKYRYDREIDRSESSALKRIMERDDSAGKPLVLTVMRVCKLVEGYELLLTDGWYTCPARTDCALDRAIISGKLEVGTKLMTQGAELVGCEQGAAPLEMPKDTYLKISTNSTRRVRWYHKLGFQKLRYPPSVSLKSILPHGGIISCIRVAVVRVYPIVYIEKNKDGTRVTRNSKAEGRAASLFMQEQESRMEKLYSQVQKEMSAKSSSKVRRVTRLSLNSISNLSAEELSDILENAPDPASIEAMLSEEQKDALWKYQESRRFNAGKELQQKMEAEKMHKRDVRSVLRVRLVELDNSSDFSALLSWWQPAEDLLSLFVEGRALALFNVTPGNSSGQNQIYLNSSRGTRIEQLAAPSGCLPLRNILRVDNISSDFTPILGEIDVVGLVVYIHTVTQGALSMQTVYLTDTGQCYFGLVFWRGLQEFSCEDTLAEGLVISASNVQWRRTSSSGAILCGYVTEFTLFTQKSKSSLVQTVIDQVKEDLEEEDIPTLIEKCQDEITTRLQSFKNAPVNKSNVSNTSVGNVSELNDLPGNSSVDTSIPKNASPLPRPRYLNGFAQTPKASSTPVKVRTPAQRRMEKLQQFGEPPPLSPIPTYHASKSKPFRPPLNKSTTR